MRRDVLRRLEKFTCPHCGQLVGCDELGRVGMYSLKVYNRHVARCLEILEACRAGDALAAERAKRYE